MLTPRKPSRSTKYVETGAKIGRLTVGELAQDVINHPLLPETSMGYLHQGRLRECLCECGTVKLIPEVTLAAGRVKSCGCLRREIITKSLEEKLAYRNALNEKRIVSSEIQKIQIEFRLERNKDSRLRDESKITEIAARLRQLFARKQELQNELRRMKN
jgi:hypothetical protein